MAHFRFTRVERILTPPVLTYDGARRYRARLPPHIISPPVYSMDVTATEK